MNACKSGSKKVVADMLKRGAYEVIDELQSRPKITAAHEAAKSGALECLQVRAIYFRDVTFIFDIIGFCRLLFCRLGFVRVRRKV